MKEILISDSELEELVLILQMSLYDADVAINQSHDIEEIDALRKHKKTVNKWLDRFLQLKALRQERTSR
jgi:hypothetical protein